MKAAVIVTRNDNYGGNQHYRTKMCLDNLSKVFDYIFVVDWKCVDDVSLLESMKYKRSNVVDIKIKKSFLAENFPYMLKYPVVETVGRNIGIRIAIDNGIDWICSTNQDILMEPFNEHQLKKDTLYTVRKRHILQHEYETPSFNFNNILKNKEIYRREEYASRDGKDLWDPGDRWSIAVCCGDFQLAHKDLWSEIRGFEEEMLGRGYADSNLMKRPILIGKNAEELDIGIFHLDHGRDPTTTSDEILPVNDRIKYVNNFVRSSNKKTWGMHGLINYKI